MPKADSVLSTPPTNIPVDTTRRRFFSQAAGMAAGGGVLALAAISPAAIAATPASPLVGPYSPALVDASRALQAAHDAMQAASVVYEAADTKATAWEREHPQPKSRKGIRKWIKKAGNVHEKLVRPSWLDLLSAEQAFTDAQVAFAKVRPRDERDLMSMAAHAIVYDEVSLTRRNTAPISRVVAYHVLRFRSEGMAS